MTDEPEPDMAIAIDSAAREAAKADELARLEREIAEYAARDDIDRYSFPKRKWRDLSCVAPATPLAAYVGNCVRYLELRGLLERHPERRELVRFVEKSDDQ